MLTIKIRPLLLHVCLAMFLFAPLRAQRAESFDDTKSSSALDRQSPTIQNMPPSKSPGSDVENHTSDNATPQPPQLSLEDKEKPTEFQDFLYTATGLRFEIFGHDLFRNVPSTFAPVDRIPVTPEYVIGPGDEILLRAWGQVDINYRAVVDRVGNIYVPKIGEISVAGIKYGQLQPYLKQSIERIFKNFELNVTLGQLRSIQIFVVGEARRPGSYTVSSLSTVINAIFASGGPSNRGSMRGIQLKRGNQVVTTIDLYDLLAKGDKSKDVPLLPGDLIYIPPATKLVAITGSINVPAIYEINEDSTLNDLIKIAGELTPTARKQRITVERISANGLRTVEEFLVDSNDRNRKLANGDLITVHAVSGEFQNAVTLRGNVALPGRYPWVPEMRIKDLIPSPEALITRSYWEKQTQLGRQVIPIGTAAGSMDTGSDNTSLDLTMQDQQGKIDENRKSSGTVAAQSQTAKGEVVLEANIKRTSPEINWDYAVIQRFDKKSLVTNLISFNLRKAILEADDPNNIALQPGDVLTIFSQDDIQIPIGKHSKFVRLEGEFNASGVYEVLPGETLPELVRRVGGLTPQAYLFGSDFSRESVRLAQQTRLDEFVDRLARDVERHSSIQSQNVATPEEALGLSARAEIQRRLVEKLRQIKATGRLVLGINPEDQVDALPNITLEDGDRFIVPFRSSMVNVVGAVYYDNSFIYQPSKRVSYYLKRAGGGTKDADLKRVFVVRADGSVTARNDSGSWFSAGFNDLRLMPGDTIVIPERLDKVGLLKGLRDWSQVLSQFAFGTAAIVELSRLP